MNIFYLEKWLHLYKLQIKKGNGCDSTRITDMNINYSQNLNLKLKNWIKKLWIKVWCISFVDNMMIWHFPKLNFLCKETYIKSAEILSKHCNVLPIFNITGIIDFLGCNISRSYTVGIKWWTRSWNMHQKLSSTP